MVLKRDPAPAGAITDLFDQLHELHLYAGEPGVRQIATGIGRGVCGPTFGVSMWTSLPVSM